MKTATPGGAEKTVTAEAVPVRASPAKLATLLNLAIHRLEQAADVAATLELTQRERSIRTLISDVTRQLDLL